MSRLFYHVMQDNVGNLLFDVSGTMRVAGSGTLATIYGDEALTVILPNPMTNHPSFGSFKCFLGAGDYDFYMAKSGYTFETLTGVQGHGSMAQQDAGAVAITGGTAQLTRLALNSVLDAAYALKVGSGFFMNPAGDQAGVGSVLVPGVALSVGGIVQASSLQATGIVQGAAFTGGTGELISLAINGLLDVAYGLKVGSGFVMTPAGDRLGLGSPLVSGIALAVSGTVQATSLLATGIVQAGGALQAVGSSEGLRCQNVGAMQGDAFSNRIAFGWDGAMKARVDGTQLGTVNITPPSDGRLKQDVQADVPGLEAVLALRPVSFVYDQSKRPVGFPEGRHYGLVAQEAQPQVPLVVTEDGSAEGWLGLDYSGLVPVLIQAVHDLAQQVEMLQAQVAEAGV